MRHLAWAIALAAVAEVTVPVTGQALTGTWQSTDSTAIPGDSVSVLVGLGQPLAVTTHGDTLAVHRGPVAFPISFADDWVPAVVPGMHAEVRARLTRGVMVLEWRGDLALREQWAVDSTGEVLTIAWTRGPESGQVTYRLHGHRERAPPPAVSRDTTITEAQFQEEARRHLERQDRTRGHRILRQLREQLDRYYFDTTWGGKNLDSIQHQTDIAIDTVSSVPAMFAAIAQFLNELNDSHTWFIPPTLSVDVNYGFRWRIVGQAAYVVAVTEGSDAEAQGLRKGDRIVTLDGLRLARTNDWIIQYVYRALSPRPGMRLVVDRPDSGEAPITIHSVMHPHPLDDFTNLAFVLRYSEAAQAAAVVPHKVRTWGDSVMLWRMPRFAYGDEEIDRLMQQARQYAWLILDLRSNHGGSVATEERLMGHFVPDSTLLLTERWRDSTVQRWVHPADDRPFPGQVLVLINSESASAAEITARALQLRGATVIGDRSAGAVRTSYQIPLELGSIFEARVVPFGMSVTISDVIMSDGNGLEGVGVIPNAAALPTGADLAAGRDPALQFALELAGVRLTGAEAGAVYDQ